MYDIEHTVHKHVIKDDKIRIKLEIERVFQQI